MSNHNSIVTLLKAANAATKTMLNKIRAAAKLAAAEFDHKLPIKERVDAVVKSYAADLKGMDPNVGRTFGNMLFLLAAGDTPITVTVGKEEKHTTAAAAVELAKHPLTAAATEARRAHGVARKVSSTRATAKPTAKPAATAKPKTSDEFTVWLDNMAAFLDNPMREKKVIAKLKELGYKVS